MIMGIISIPLLCCGFFAYGLSGVVSAGLGIAALIVGINARRQIRASQGMLGGDGMALTGIITGAIGGALGVLSLLIGIVVIILVAAGLVTGVIPLPCPTPSP